MKRLLFFTKILLVLILPILTISTMGCDSSDDRIKYSRQLGTAAEDWGTGIAMDNNGNLYITGRTSGSLDGNTNANEGSSDIFLVKYNAAGEKEWTRQIGNESYDMAWDVAADNIGNVYIIGETRISFDGNVHNGGFDMVVIKYNSSGEKLWSRQFGSLQTDIGNGITVDTENNVYITGYTYGDLNGNSKSHDSDIFLIKLSPSGDTLWITQVDSDEGRQTEKASSVAADTSGNVYVAGYTQGGVGGNTNAGGFDMVLVKYSSSGERIWTQQFGTSASDFAEGITTDSAGNIYVTGSTEGGMDGNRNKGFSDICLVKFNPDGTKVWTQQMGSFLWDDGRDVAVGPNGNIYVGGYAAGSIDGNSSIGKDDIFVAEFSPAGEKIESALLGTKSNDHGDGIVLDSSGNIYIGGFTEGSLYGNTNSGARDLFIMKLSN